MGETPETQECKLEPDSELRFEVEKRSDKVTVVLKSGLAEVFGTELIKNRRYTFEFGSKVAVFSWHGCVLELTGKPVMSYIAKETPMGIYLNCHSAMEGMRDTAEKRIAARERDVRGPTVMVVGPCDVGKSTLCRILLNYGVRMGRRPIFADLDIGQGNIAIPGTVGAFIVERPSDIVTGFVPQEPLALHFGHKSPSANISLYKQLITRLAEACRFTQQTQEKVNVSGIVINTCGWIKGGGYELLTHAAEAFEVDAILVIDQERLFNCLIREMPPFVRVVFLPKSRGVVERSTSMRIEARERRVREYFYGITNSPLHPHSVQLAWSEIRIFKIAVPAFLTSCAPFGVKSEDSLTKLIPITPGPNLLHHVLSVSCADSQTDDVIQTNVAGFICVTNVDVERETITALSPRPLPLPHTVLLWSDIQFTDT